MALSSKLTWHTKARGEATYTERDAIILVMGPSGSGKSTFINKYLGREEATVTHGFRTCTTSITPYPSLYSGSQPFHSKHRVILVDTPGLFGGELNELNTLEQISSWLRPKDEPARHLSGVIYLHDMTQKRIQRETRLSLELFRKICGEDSCAKTVLVKTQWPSALDRQTLARSKDLEDDFFKNMKNAGARCMDIVNGVTERDVVNYILTNATAQDILLQLQRELDTESNLARTAAGKELRVCLLELLRHTDPGSQREQIEAIKQTLVKLEVSPSLSQRIKLWTSKISQK